ncbi:MAG: HAMP domain-containing histidine kinase, partial [Deltaproteobacteria bacterium]|nr:HAMP domain-containing histidine kinase [Deltaproteobacteria bacterium]
WLWALLFAAFLALAYAGLRVALAMRRERRAIVEEQRAIDQRKRFVRLASHELRKPLTRMAHRAEMLAMPEMQDQRDLIARYADALVKDSGHLARLVESLLDQAKVEQGLDLDRKPHNLRALVETIVRDVKDDDIRVDADIPASSVWAEIDPLYVQMALRNLLDNAQKYAGDDPRVAVTLRVANDRAVIRVCDDGPGIPTEEAERIFQPFHRGKTSPEHGGFGLGLPLARDIARAHDGDLILETPREDHPGACFSLSLPTAHRPDNENA